MKKYRFQKHLSSATPIVNDNNRVKEWKIQVEYQAIDYDWTRVYSHTKDVETENKRTVNFSKEELVEMMPGEIDNYFFHKHLEKHCNQIKKQTLENFDLDQLKE